MVLSMVAAPAFMGAAAADHEPDATSVDGDGERYWVGQTLNITDFTTGETVEFTHEDSFRQRTATDGTVQVTTTNWATGDWSYEGQDSETSGNFTLSEQSLETFEFSPENASGDTTLEITSNRAEFNVSISADGLDAEDLDAAFEDGRIAEHGDDESVYVVPVTDAQAELTVDSTELDTGEYEFEGEVVDSTASASATLNVEDPTEVDASFVGGPYDEEEGDIAEIEVDAQATDDAYVNMSLEDYDYTATIPLTGLEDADDTVTIEVNTYLIGQDGENAFTGEYVGNDVEESGDLLDQVDEDTRFTDGFSFRLRAYTDDPRGQDANPTGVSRLRLQDRSTDGVTMHVAPFDADLTADNVDDLTADATEDDTVAVPGDDADGDVQSDVVIAQVEASGIYGYLGNNASNFDEAGENLSFYLQTTQEGAFGASDVTLNIDDELENSTLVVDEDNDQFFVALDPDDHDDISADTDWEAVFEAGYENSYISGDDEDATESVNASFTAEERTLEIVGDFDQNDRLQVDASEGSEITAETNVAPNTTGTYFVETQNDAASDEFTVGQEGEVTAELDFSGAEDGEILPSIDFDEDGGVSDSVEGIFGEGDAASFVASGDAPDQVDVDGDATLDATVENQGGSSDEASISVTIDGEEVAAENVELDSGETWEDSFEIPTDEEGEIEWEIDAGTSSDSGTVQVGEAPSDDTGGDDMDGDDAAGDDTGGDDGGDDGQPGFGVFVALFALIGAALLALRRQN